MNRRAGRVMSSPYYATIRRMQTRAPADAGVSVQEATATDGLQTESGNQFATTTISRMSRRTMITVVAEIVIVSAAPIRLSSARAWSAA